MTAAAVREIGLRDAKDEMIWQYALRHDAVIVTKDEDFANRSIGSDLPPVVVWLRIGNATNPALLTWFLPLLPFVLAKVNGRDRVTEVR